LSSPTGLLLITIKENEENEENGTYFSLSVKLSLLKILDADNSVKAFMDTLSFPGLN